MCLDYDYLGSRSDGGFAEYCLVPSEWHFVESTNPDLSDDALAMVEPCTVAQHAIRKSGLTAGQNLLIFGAGPIGQMAARWGKIFGASTVVLVDVLDEKVEYARSHGNIAFNSTGAGAALGLGIECCKTFGTVVMMGNPHRDTTIKLAQHSMILRKELVLRGIWNSHYAQSPINEWQYTVQMLDEGRMQVEDLITHRSTLDGIPKLCEDIYTHKVSICKALYSVNAK